MVQCLTVEEKPPVKELYVSERISGGFRVRTYGGKVLCLTSGGITTEFEFPSLARAEKWIREGTLEELREELGRGESVGFLDRK